MSLGINHNLMAGNVAKNLNSHYASLGDSTRRLSSGLRINSASDDAAGLAVRELQRADVASLKQGSRNANDAISMIQTADGALAIIDEKLIRMNELAEQAATGTYDSTQRLMIDSEFQAMAAEINRIANSTDFNGIHLLNGNLGGTHNGAGLQSTGALKVHFGTGNDSAEDYYYVNIPSTDVMGLNLGGSVSVSEAFPPASWSITGTDITTATNSILGNGLTLAGTPIYTGSPQSLGVFTNGQGAGLGPPMSNGLILSSGNVNAAMNTPGSKASGVMGTAGDPALNAVSGQNTLDASRIDIPFTTNSNTIFFDFVFASEEYPTYVGSINDVCGIFLDGVNMATLNNVVAIDTNPPPAGLAGPISINNIFSNPALFVNNQSGANSFAANGFSKTFRIGIPVTPGATQTLSIAVADAADRILDSWVMVNNISTSSQSTTGTNANTTVTPVDIRTQERAQYALGRVKGAIVIKDGIRAHLGALQNRLENTITNLNIQAENLQVAESRISDVDVATEMTNYTRNQILTQSSVAMLAQANSLPKMAMQIIGA